ncbi:hypothetical protein K466DRAFT_304036 [Polyporus arcularius HHB13444]|uniref:Uncharacterized protein n=1 Tax=Polyporus arcularius HHB13444 TaxID=1314778 RepID=A0A5C3NYD5_9APHY|nr:hypothetical protein K466DRAFT_304036 [Polyporus arcularius HHB13444]
MWSWCTRVRGARRAQRARRRCPSARTLRSLDVRLDAFSRRAVTASFWMRVRCGMGICGAEVLSYGSTGISQRRWRGRVRERSRET